MHIIIGHTVQQGNKDKQGRHDDTVVMTYKRLLLVYRCNCTLYAPGYQLMQASPLIKIVDNWVNFNLADGFENPFDRKQLLACII